MLQSTLRVDRTPKRLVLTLPPFARALFQMMAEQVNGWSLTALLTSRRLLGRSRKSPRKKPAEMIGVASKRRASRASVSRCNWGPMTGPALCLVSELFRSSSCFAIYWIFVVDVLCSVTKRFDAILFKSIPCNTILQHVKLFLFLFSFLNSIRLSVIAIHIDGTFCHFFTIITTKTFRRRLANTY